MSGRPMSGTFATLVRIGRRAYSSSTSGSLAGRTVVVTGGSRGIGLAIAKRAAADGANIVIGAKTVEALGVQA